MTSFLHILLLIPLCGWVLSLFWPRRSETGLARLAAATVGLHMLASLAFLGFWMFSHHPVVNIRDFVLFESDHYCFFIDLYFDEVSAVYLITGTILAFLVTVYSRVYMHRESGFKRFFNTILLFYTGYVITILSGNLETLFIGWECLGISSFLLIAFYRERYLPVRNAIKVFSIYRLGDIGLILAMWMSHHLWHENVVFDTMRNAQLVDEHLISATGEAYFIAFMLLIAAAAKSAQLPFSAWLPRAMEGPTPSSAIFYGSLSVHMGVFLLLRTFPFWDHLLGFRIAVGVLGVLTSLVAVGVARVQSSVKSQIAYASIAQIGLIFMEIALGLEWLALFHFAGNAFLRTYQLLVSPSVVSYLIREQFFTWQPRAHTVEDSLPRRLQYALYALSLKEWNLDAFIYRMYWNPIKQAGRRLSFLQGTGIMGVILPVYAAGLGLLYAGDAVPEWLRSALPSTFAFLGLLMVVRAFTERKNVYLAMFMVVLNHFWLALAISFNEHYSMSHTLLYLSGIVASGLLGYVCLRMLRQREKRVALDRFQGHSREHPRIGIFFLLACLGLTGFPITPTFIGEDLIFSHIHADQPLLAFLTALSLIIDGLAMIRMYARLFMGGSANRNYHESAYKSS